MLLIERLVAINSRVTLWCVDLSVVFVFFVTSYPTILKYSSCFLISALCSISVKFQDCCLSKMADVYNIKFCYTVLKRINCHNDDCSVYLDCDKHIKLTQWTNNR